jgi:hypothetical protein
MWRFNIIRGLQERSGMASLHLAQDREKWRDAVNMAMILQVTKKCEKFHDWVAVNVSKRTLLLGVSVKSQGLFFHSMEYLNLCCYMTLHNSTRFYFSVGLRIGLLLESITFNIYTFNHIIRQSSGVTFGSLMHQAAAVSSAF